MYVYGVDCLRYWGIGGILKQRQHYAHDGYG